jgi:hypothetical protein
MATKIDPKQLCTDLGTQIRVDWNEDAVKEYAEKMERGVQLPPILVFYDERNHRFILVDGFHRLAAHLRVRPNDLILVELQLGDVETARWAAIIANQSHGIRRTSADKRNAIKQAFLHCKGAGKSNSKLATELGVDDKTVASVRREMESSSEIPKTETRIVQRGNQTYYQNTSPIGVPHYVSSASSEIPKIESPHPSRYTVNTSRIKFGGKTVPKGATCGNCRYFENQKCLTNEIEHPNPLSDVCDEFEVQGVEPPPAVIAPPDYKNTRPLGKKLKRTRHRRLFQNRDLKNCIAVHLPSNNAERFAAELRENWEKPYLIECLVALKQLLEDDEDRY